MASHVDREIESSLRTLLGVDEGSVERVRSSVAARIAAASAAAAADAGSEPVTTLARPGPAQETAGWVAAAAAMITAALAFLALGSVGSGVPAPAPERVVRPPVESDAAPAVDEGVPADRGAPADAEAPAAEPLVIEIALSLPPPQMAYDDDPRQLGRLVREADVIVVGTVGEVGGDAVSFTAETLLLGDEAALRRGIGRGGDGPRIACHSALVWEEGEHVVLFLQRSAEGRLEVLYDGAGKNTLPMVGLFEQGDLVEVVERGRLSPERAAAIVRDAGPRALRTLASQLADLPSGAFPVASDAVQRAIRDALVVAAARGEYPRTPAALQDVLAACDHLEPDGVRSLPAEVGAWIRDTVLPGLPPAYARRFQVPRILRPFALARATWARAAVDAHVAEAEASARARPVIGAYQSCVQAWDQLAAYDRAAAAERASAALEGLPKIHGFDGGEILIRLLVWEADGAERELLRRVTEQRMNGDPVWLDVLLHARSDAARRVACEVMSDASFTLARLRYPHHPLRLVGTPEAAARLAPVAHVIATRVENAARTGSIREARGWLELHLAAGGDPALALRTVAARVADETGRDADPEDWRIARRELVRRLEVGLGQRLLPWRDPTAAELLALVEPLEALAARRSGVEHDPEIAKRVRAGRRHFEAMQCRQCHRLNGIGGMQAGTGSELAGVATRYIEAKGSEAAAREWFYNHITDPRAYPGLDHPVGFVKMPSYREKLTDAQRRDVAEFLMTLRRSG